MNETQLQLFPAFRSLPVYDESDERSHTITTWVGNGRGVRECVRLAEVEECLKDPRLVPLGAIRVGADGRTAVVVYFGELT